MADSWNSTIRKVTQAGVVTTLAGLVGCPCYGDGTGTNAGFAFPIAVAVDSTGTVYVTDIGKDTIRKVTVAGAVTTLAGYPGTPGSLDGTGTVARFYSPHGVAVDSVGNIYIADTFNNTIRKGYLENLPAVIVTAQPGLGFNGGQFGFMLTGPAGHLVVVEASIDLATWLPLWTNTFEGVLNFSDPQSGSHFKRFYRAHLP